MRYATMLQKKKKIEWFFLQYMSVEMFSIHIHQALIQ